MADNIQDLIINGDTENVEINSILPHPKNANKGDLESIDGSVESTGFYGFVIVQRRKGKKGRILAGEHRWRVLKSKGSPIVPVLWLDVDDGTAEDILLADNRTSELGERDLDKLGDLLARAMARQDKGRDIRGTGYTSEEAQSLLESFRLFNPDEIPTSSPEDFWPIIHISVPPALHEKWTKVLTGYRTKETEEPGPAWQGVERILKDLE